MRYYDHGGRRVHFTDIAQLRERDGRLWYDYWELTGAKMWITNGRMAGVMCLYAKTDEGVTGFIVDRHAEGLVVGKDEEKMGQCGSPTNELSLQAVRVPRENVLGLEGRGQVNALETLNVGRAGLAMSAMAQMDGLIEQSRAFARADLRRASPTGSAWRLERMEEDRFIAEALAFEVVGRFEHPQTKSVRLESAIAKMLVSELLHRVIEPAEEIHGLAGQTQLTWSRSASATPASSTSTRAPTRSSASSSSRTWPREVAPRWAKSRPAARSSSAARRWSWRRSRRSCGSGSRRRSELRAGAVAEPEPAGQLLPAGGGGGLAEGGRQHAGPAGLARPPGRSGRGRRPRRTWRSAGRALARCQPRSATGCGASTRNWPTSAAAFTPPRSGRPRSCSSRPRGSRPHRRDPPSQVTRPLSVLVVLEPSAAAVPQPHVADGRLLEAVSHSATSRPLRPGGGPATPRRGERRQHPGGRGRLRASADVLREALVGRGSCSARRRRKREIDARLRRGRPGDGPRPAPAFDLVLGGGGGEGEEGLLPGWLRRPRYPCRWPAVSWRSDHGDGWRSCWLAGTARAGWYVLCRRR